MKSKRFRKIAGVLSFLTFLFTTLGIHFIHLFSQHHCIECSHLAVNIDIQNTSFSIDEKCAQYKSEWKCPICLFLQYTHFNKSQPHAFLDQEEGMSEFLFLLKTPFVKQTKFVCLSVRAPPVFPTYQRTDKAFPTFWPLGSQVDAFYA